MEINDIEDVQEISWTDQQGMTTGNIVSRASHLMIISRPKNKMQELFSQNMEESEVPQKCEKIATKSRDEQQEQEVVQSFFQNLIKQLQNFSKTKLFFVLELICQIVVLIAITAGASSKELRQQIVQITDFIEVVFFSLLLLLFLVKISNWSNHFTRYWLLNFLSIIAGIVGALVVHQTVRRILKALRVLILAEFTIKTQCLCEPLKNLTKSLSKIVNMLLPAFLIIYIYAIIGLYSFSGYQYSKCRDPSNIHRTQNWTVYKQQIYLCGQKSCPIVNSVQYQCLNPLHYGVQPNEQQLINMVQGNGLLHFGNIFYSLLSTVKQTFITGSSRLIILYKQALPYIYVQIYFLSYIYLISYIYMNIFYGLILMDSWDITDQNQHDVNTQKSLENKTAKQEKYTSKSKISIFNEKTEKTGNNHRRKNFFLNNQTNNERKKKIKFILEEKNIFQDIMPSEEASVQEKNNEKEKELEEFSKATFNNFQKSTEKSAFKQNLTEFMDVKKSDKVYIITHHIIVIGCCINLSVEYRGQSERSSFIVDLLDCLYFSLFTLDFLFRLYKKFWVKKKMNNSFFFLVFIWIFSSFGMVYELVKANTLYQFIHAEDSIADICRSSKYLLFVIMLLETPYFSETKKIVKAIVRAVLSIKNIIMLWIFGTFVLAVIGYQLHFGKTIVNDKGEIDLQNGQPHQISYNGLLNSIIFTILTIYNEQWDYLMFQQYLGSGVSIIIWQLFTLIIGLVLVSKYFMAMLVKQLDTIITQEDNLSVFIQNQKGEYSENQLIQNFSDDNSNQSNASDEKNNIFSDFSQQTKNVNQISELSEVKLSKLERKQQNSQNQDINLTNSIFCKRIKNLMVIFVSSKIFVWLRVIIYILNFVSLTQTHPHVDRTSEEVCAFLVIENICRIFFLLQLILNLSVFGLYEGKNAYLKRSYLNYFNFPLTILQMLSFTQLRQFYIFVRIERLRVLRLFNLIEMRYRRNWNMRILITAMVRLIPKVFNLLLINFVFYYYFALVLVKLYENDDYSCVNNYSEGVQIVTKQDCFNWGGDWITSNINNSNILQSLIYLFLVATTEGWITLMIPAMNLNGVDMQPKKNANQHINIFFVVFFFFGNLLILNSFIGLSLWNFKKLKEKATGEERLNPNDRLWLRVQEQIHRLQPQRKLQVPKNCVREKIYRLVSSKPFFIMKNIYFISYLVLCSTYRPASNYNYLYQNVFIFIRIFQYLLELIGFGVRSQKKNKFLLETFCVFYYITFFIVRIVFTIDPQMERMFVGFLLALQCFRFLQLIDEIPFVNQCLNSLFTIIPQTINIFLIILVTLLCYTIFGMELFAFLRPGKEIDSFNLNYQNFQNALFALIKFSIMEAPINQIMDAGRQMSSNWICLSIISYDDFQKYGQNGCGNYHLAMFFFISFHIFYSLLLMSTFMTRIVDAYSEVRQEENSHITRFVLEKVRILWSKSDPEATGFIPYRQFWMFTAQLLQIYNGKINKDDISELFKQKNKFLQELNLIIYQNQKGILCFQFHQVIEAITKAYLQKRFKYSIHNEYTRKIFEKKLTHKFHISFKKTNFKSCHVASLIILKSSLRIWNRKATDTGIVLDFTEMTKKFGNNLKK